MVRQFTSLLCDYVCDYVCQLKEISWNLLFLCPVISISFLWNKILKTLELYFRTTSWFELIIILSSLSRREMEQFQRIENWNYFLFPRTVEDLDVVRDYNILIPIFHYNPFIPLSILILAVKHWTKGCAVSIDTLCKIMVLHTCTHYLYKIQVISPSLLSNLTAYLLQTENDKYQWSVAPSTWCRCDTAHLMTTLQWPGPASSVSATSLTCLSFHQLIYSNVMMCL